MRWSNSARGGSSAPPPPISVHVPQPTMRPNRCRKPHSRRAGGAPRNPPAIVVGGVHPPYSLSRHHAAVINNNTRRGGSARSDVTRFTVAEGKRRGEPRWPNGGRVRRARGERK